MNNRICCCHESYENIIIVSSWFFVQVQHRLARYISLKVHKIVKNQKHHTEVETRQSCFVDVLRLRATQRVLRAMTRRVTRMEVCN